MKGGILMDIAGLSVALNQSKVMQAASLSVMKIAMDSGKQISQQMTEMLSQPQDPNLGRFLDTKV